MGVVKCEQCDLQRFKGPTYNSVMSLTILERKHIQVQNWWLCHFLLPPFHDTGAYRNLCDYLCRYEDSIVCCIIFFNGNIVSVFPIINR